MATAVIGGLLAAGGAAAAGAAVGGVLAAGALGLAGGIFQDRAARKREQAQQQVVEEQQRQRAISNAQQSLARARAVRQSIAQSRVARAEFESRAFASGAAGAGQAITADTGSAIGAAATQEAAAFGISRSQDRQAQFSIDARSSNQFDRLAGVTQLGLTGLNLFQSGAFEGIGSLFNFGGGGGNNIDPNLSNANVFAGGFAGR